MSTNKTVTHHTEMETWHRGNEVTSHTPGVEITVEWRTGYATKALDRFDEAVHEVRRQIADAPEEDAL